MLWGLAIYGDFLICVTEMAEVRQTNISSPLTLQKTRKTTNKQASKRKRKYKKSSTRTQYNTASKHSYVSTKNDLGPMFTKTNIITTNIEEEKVHLEARIPEFQQPGQ